jgi:hypothetical protein
MTIRNLLICTTLMLALTPACSKKKDPVEETVSMLEDIGTAVDNAKGDCGKMADGVQAVANKYKPDFAAMKAASEKAKSDKDLDKKMEAKYGPRLQKAMPKLMGMMNCIDDPKFTAVSKELADFGLGGVKAKD